MAFRPSPSRLLALWLLAPAAASSACLAARRVDTGPPAVPAVAAIPVAPVATPQPAAPQPAPAQATSPATSTAPAPASPPAEPAAVEAAAAGPAASQSPPAPVDEVAPQPPADAPPPVAAPPPSRVLMVDELPYRSPRLHAKEPERPRPVAGHRKGKGLRGYHPDPGIVVDVAEAQGGVPAAELQRAARNVGYWPFRRCYEEGLRRDQRLVGRVSLELAISPAGGVDRASVGSSSLRDESVALCIHREALHMALPAGQGPTTARLDVTLSTGDEPVPVPRPVPNADALRDALRASWPAVEQCYRSGLAKRPDAGGRLELRFRANSGGQITEVSEGDDARFVDVDVTRCVLGVYRTARLPSARTCTPRGTSFYYAVHLEAK